VSNLPFALSGAVTCPNKERRLRRVSSISTRHKQPGQIRCQAERGAGLDRGQGANADPLVRTGMRAPMRNCLNCTATRLSVSGVRSAYTCRHAAMCEVSHDIDACSGEQERKNCRKRYADHNLDP